MASIPKQDADGNCFILHTDGTYPVPEGWVDADTPPPLADWVAGEWWESRGTNSSPYPKLPSRSAAEADATTRIEALDAFRYWAGGWLFTSGDQYRRGWIGDYGFGDNLYSTYINGPRNCGTTTPGALDNFGNDYCPIAAPPSVDQWPDDGSTCYDVVQTAEGNFETNQYDPDAPSPGSSDSSLALGGGETLTATDDGYSIDQGGTTAAYDADGNLIVNGVSSCFWRGASLFGASTSCTDETGTSYDINDLLNNEPLPVTEPFGENDFAEASDGASPGLPSSGGVGSVTGMIDATSGDTVTFKGCDGTIAVPAGWENGAPLIPNWIPGRFWSRASGTYLKQGQASTPAAAVREYYAVWTPEGGSRHIDAYGWYTRYYDCVFIRLASEFVAVVQRTRTHIYDGAQPDDITIGEENANAYLCNPEYHGVEEGCVATAPTEESWPSDGHYDIIMSGGKFYAASDDPDAPQSLKDGQSTITFTSGLVWTANSDGTYTVTDGSNTQTLRCDGTRAS